MRNEWGVLNADSSDNFDISFTKKSVVVRKFIRRILNSSRLSRSTNVREILNAGTSGNLKNVSFISENYFTF